MDVNDIAAEVAALPWEDVRIQVRAAMAERPAAESGAIVGEVYALDPSATAEQMWRSVLVALRTRQP